MHRQPRPPFPWRDIATHLPFALTLGVLVGFIMTGLVWRPSALVISAIIALACYGTAIVSGWMLEPWLDAGWKRGLVYFAASQVAWPVVIFIALPLWFGRKIGNIRLSRAAWVAVIVCGAAGAAIGVVAYSYQLLKDRLARSIAQLKDAEFAEKELELAREFQARMLPAPDIGADGYRIAGRNLPARYVAGDFYDVFRYADGAVGIAVADVAGKGLAASLIMASVKSVLPILASSATVADAMSALNMKLKSELSKREFVALALARFDPASGTLTVANAGFPDPYVVRGDGSVEPIELSGVRIPLGLKADVRYDERTVAIGRGDSVVFLSDGLPEATTSSGDPVGYERMIAILERTRGRADDVLAAIDALAPGPREDDQTIVVLERL